MATTRFRSWCSAALVCLCAAGCTSLDLAANQEAGVGKSVESQLAFARLCERRQAYDQATAVYESVLAREPDNFTAYHRLGVVAARQGKLDDAIESLTQAAKLTPPGAELLNDLGYAYFLQNDLGQAESYYRQALEKSSAYTAAWTNLGLVLGQQHRDEEALDALRHAGSDAEAYSSLAYVHAQLGDFEGAQSYFRKALTLQSDLQHAAEGLLQVSSQMPGREPRVIFTSHRNHSKPPDADKDATLPNAALPNPTSPNATADLPMTWNASQRPVGGDPRGGAAPDSVSPQLRAPSDARSKASVAPVASASETNE